MLLKKAGVKKTEYIPKLSLISGGKSLPKGMEKLEKYGFLKIAQKGEILAEAGEECKYCYIVKSGRIIAYEYTMSGSERVYSYNEKNSLIIEECILLDCRPPVSFKADTRSELICLDKDAIARAAREDTDIALALMRYLSYKYVSSMEQIRFANSHSASWKVCNLLLMMAENYGEDYNGYTMIREKLSQQLISSMLGINRVTVVRVMKDLKELNLVAHINGYYCIRDMEAVREYQKRMI